MCERVLLRSDGMIYKDWFDAMCKGAFTGIKQKSVYAGIKKWENNFNKYTYLSGERKEYITGKKQKTIGGYEWKIIEVGPNCFREWTGWTECPERPYTYAQRFE